MSERYWISGVQLGMLIAANNNGKEEVIDQVLKTIENEQFVGNTRPRPSEVKKPEGCPAFDDYGNPILITMTGGKKP